jgi:para-aminobenzoate synthetase
MLAAPALFESAATEPWRYAAGHGNSPEVRYVTITVALIAPGINMASPEQTVLAELSRLSGALKRPIVVALDGGSGAGKSTIARRLMRATGAALVPLDAFYQTVIPEAEWPNKTVAQRLNGVFDWSRIRRHALEPLRAGRPGRWHAFDFTRGLGEAGTYQLEEQEAAVAPTRVVLIEGAYSASPPLRDLIDLAVLVDAPEVSRHARTLARGDDPVFLAQWHQVWDEVESYYFTHVCPPASFDLVIRNDTNRGIPSGESIVPQRGSQ